MTLGLDDGSDIDPRATVVGALLVACARHRDARVGQILAAVLGRDALAFIGDGDLTMRLLRYGVQMAPDGEA